MSVTNQEMEEIILACHEYFSKYLQEKDGRPLPDMTFGMMDEITDAADRRLEYFS